MEENVVQNIHEVFNNLVKMYGFCIKDELNDGQSYSIEYCDGTIVIRLEKYWREFYLTVYKVSDPDRGIDLFNLLDYVSQGGSIAPRGEYFQKEKNLEESYRKQLAYITDVIYDNYAVINDFFRSDNFESRCAALEMFMVKKYPDLWKGLTGRN